MTLPEKRENPDKDHNKPVAEQTIEQQLQDAREQVLKMFSAKKNKKMIRSVRVKLQQVRSLITNIP